MSFVSRMERVSESPSSPGIMMSSTIEVDVGGLQRLPRRRGVLGDARAEPMLHEKAREEIADVAMVVDDEDVRRALHGSELTRSFPRRCRKIVTDCVDAAAAPRVATKKAVRGDRLATIARQSPPSSNEHQGDQGS